MNWLRDNIFLFGTALTLIGAIAYGAVADKELKDLVAERDAKATEMRAMDKQVQALTLKLEHSICPHQQSVS